MKANLRPIGLLVGLIVVVVLYFLMQIIQQGLFASVKLTEKDAGPYTLVYTKYIGEYKNVGPVMDSVYYDLKKKYGITTTKGFGIYYDDPSKVSKDKLRSVVGCIVDQKSGIDLDALKDRFGVYEYPLSNSVVAEFPYNGKISIIIGIIKAYPKLTSYTKEKNYAGVPIMELYDRPNKKIEYIVSHKVDLQTFMSILDNAK